MDDAHGKTKYSHILRPHHLLLLYIMMFTFSEASQKKFPPAFLLHVYRFLLRHVTEVAEPSSFDKLMVELGELPAVEGNDPKFLVQALNDPRNEPHNVDQLTVFFGAMSWLFVDKGEAEAPLARRSIFGYFCRRCFVTFVKLSFSGADQLQRDYLAWKSGDNSAGYENRLVDTSNDDAFIFKTTVDKKRDVKTDPLANFRTGFANGDELSTADNLRAFFEQHFHESLDSGYRQHALLQHGRVHYLRQEYEEARKLLQEAIALCRVKNDRVTLMHCMALLHRLPPVERGQKPTLNETQPELHPNELLYDVSKLLDPETEQPLSTTFRKITEAIGVYTHYVDSQGHHLPRSDQWGQHAVQSLVWETAGRYNLAQIESNIVLTGTEAGTDDNNRLVMLLNSSYKVARNGAYDQALAVLLEPDVWRGLDFVQYNQWAMNVWHVLVLRGSRRGMLRQYREVLLPRRPSVDYSSRYYWHEPNNSAEPASIQSRLHDVLYMRRHDQAPAAIEQLLTALWKAEFQGQYGLYRTGIVLLADVGLEFGMSERCKKILEEIMPQILAQGDTEEIAFSQFTFARCLVACGDSSAEALKPVLPWLISAVNNYQKLEMWASAADVLYYLAVVYDNLGNVGARDKAADAQVEMEGRLSQAEHVVVEETVIGVWELVKQIGAALAARK